MATRPTLPVVHWGAVRDPQDDCSSVCCSSYESSDAAVDAAPRENLWTSWIVSGGSLRQALGVDRVASSATDLSIEVGDNETAAAAANQGATDINEAFESADDEAGARGGGAWASREAWRAARFEVWMARDSDEVAATATLDEMAEATTMRRIARQCATSHRALRAEKRAVSAL